MEYRIDECAAHVVYFVDKVVRALVWDPVVVDTVYALIPRVVMPTHAGYDMDLVAFSLKSSGKFSYMSPDTADTYRVQ